VVVVVVVVLLVVAGLAVYGYYTTVDATAVNVYAPDNVCGLNVYSIFYTGFNVSTGASVPLTLSVPNNNSTSCTLRGVALASNSSSSGFGLGDVQLPPAIPGNTTGTPATGTLNVTLTVPGSHYTGVVNLVFR